MCRERRSWTREEDQLLRDAVNLGESKSTLHCPTSTYIILLSPLEEPRSNSPSKWHAIAKHVPRRTNKDCRKRWFAKMASNIVKGGWATEEDQRLVKAIEKYGTRSVTTTHN